MFGLHFLERYYLSKENQTIRKHVHAVAIKRAGRIVGHVPFNLAPTVSAFLRRSRNKCLAEVRGSKVNRGGGYGLEIPCEYHFFGPKDYIDKLETICKNLQSKELL
jgi:hypothetical protein